MKVMAEVRYVHASMLTDKIESQLHLDTSGDSEIIIITKNTKHILI